MIRTLALLPLFAVGCIFQVDSDDDGLRNGEEKDLGTNPDVADTDGDGISDGTEVNETFTNPLSADTDEDGYLDGDELREGTNPNDDDDRIYEGGWPYNGDKDGLEEELDADFDGMPIEVGGVFPRHQGRDQFRDRVDLYDFAEQGNYTVIDASATWCGPCQLVASWLAGEDNFGIEDQYEGEYGKVRRKLNRGELFWVTVMTDGNSERPAPIDEVEFWDAEWPNENVMVMTDRNENVLRAINFDGTSGLAWPNYVVVDENMEVVAAGGTGDALGFLMGEL